MLAGLAQLEFDILGLDSWWIGLTDQGHEGRCYSDSLHSWRFSSDTRPSLWRTNCGKGLPQVGVGTFIHRGGLHRLGRRVSYSWRQCCRLCSHEPKSGWTQNSLFLKLSKFSCYLIYLLSRGGNGWIWHVETGLPLPFVRWMRLRQSAKNKPIPRSPAIWFMWQRLMKLIWLLDNMFLSLHKHLSSNDLLWQLQSKAEHQ